MYNENTHLVFTRKAVVNISANKIYMLEGLKAARERKGITQKGLADLLGIGTATVSSWEQGRANPPFETLMKLPEMLDCDLDYLSGRLSEPTHDIQFIHDQTGLSETAIQKLIILKKWPYFREPLSHLIESDGITNFLMTYRSFLDLLGKLKHTDGNEDRTWNFPEYRLRGDDKVVMSTDEAVHHFMHKLANEMMLICEAEYQRKIRQDRITGRAYEMDDLLEEIKGVQSEINYLTEHKQYLEEEVLPQLKDPYEPREGDEADGQHVKDPDPTT